MTARPDISQANEIISIAARFAKTAGNEYVTVDHLTAALLTHPATADTLLALKVDVKSVLDTLVELFQSDIYSHVNLTGTGPRMTRDVSEVVHRATAAVMFSNREALLGTDLLVAIMSEGKSQGAYLLQENGLKLLELKSYLAHGGAADDDAADDISGDFSKDKAAKILAKYTVNLNEMAGVGKIDPLIGREDNIYHLVKTIARRTKNNAVLVGEPGVGKTAIVEGLAKLIVEGKVPDVIKGSTVYSLDVAALMAGAKFRGDMEERMKGVLKALETVDHPILFIDEIHMILGAGSSTGSSMDVANLLKPALARGQLRCVGSTTTDEYRKHFEKDKALVRRFQKQDVFEPTPEDAKRILHGLKDAYESFHNIVFTADALDAAVDLTHRYMNDRFLPDKAIDVLDAAGAAQRIAPDDQRVHVIDVALIEAEVSTMAKIPPRTVKEDESAKLAHLAADLHKVVYGQEQAIATLDDAVIMARAGLRERGKTLGSYLFTGPTGVGKTEVVKQLAASLGLHFLRYDMSEFMEKHTVSRLIGAPPGYVGYGDGATGSGKLINDINTHPHCVLLLDEIEKAHPDVFNVLLQVMDNGRITGSDGKEARFDNVILVMTSNVGAAAAAKHVMGFAPNRREGEEEVATNELFSPEFRNRLDAVIRFNKLKPEHILLVVDKFIKQLNELSLEKNVTVTVQDDARQWLATKGFDPAMGARPLGRVIAENIKKPLSREMLFGNLKHGGEAVVSVGEDGQLMILYVAAPVSVVEAPVEAQPEPAE